MILQTLYGETYNKRLSSFYAEIYKTRFGEYPKVKYTPIFYVLLKRAFEKYGEIKLAGAILVHFEQNGKRIQEEKFPFNWVFRNIDEYLKYLQDEKGIDIDNEEELYTAIETRLKFLDVNFCM